MDKKIFAYFIAPGFIFFLLGTYLLAPDFYLTYILQKAAREQQLVEMITFSCCLLAGISLLHSGCLLWNKRKPLNTQWGALLVFLLAFAALFFGGEEISWGQTYLGWNTPSKYAQASVETNLHNTNIPVQSLGSFFIISVFFILPLLARYWKKLSSIFTGIKSGVPQSPAIFLRGQCLCMEIFQVAIPTFYFGIGTRIFCFLSRICRTIKRAERDAGRRGTLDLRSKHLRKYLPRHSKKM